MFWKRCFEVLDLEGVTFGRMECGSLVFISSFSLVSREMEATAVSIKDTLGSVAVVEAAKELVSQTKICDGILERLSKQASDVQTFTQSKSACKSAVHVLLKAVKDSQLNPGKDFSAEVDEG